MIKNQFFLIIAIVVFTIAIWILALNNLFNPLLAMILMILIIRLDMKNKEKEEREKMK
jgi:Flp pilus assembly protein TadB